jgi:hypothetical protein
LNENDPIYDLRKSHGWKAGSDDYWRFGKYGYYVVLQHPKVRNNGRILVMRIYEFEEMKEDQSTTEDGRQRWRAKLDGAIDRDGPVLVMDYTYFGLLRDKNARVGGVIYGRSAKLNGVEFYAPLAKWSEQLAVLLEGENQGIH